MAAVQQLLKTAALFIQLDLSQEPRKKYQSVLTTAVGNMAGTADLQQTLAAFGALQDSFAETRTTQRNASSLTTGRLTKLQAALTRYHSAAEALTVMANSPPPSSSETALGSLLPRRGEAVDAVRMALAEIAASDTTREQQEMAQVKQDLEKQTDCIQALAALLGVRLAEQEDESDTSAEHLLQIWRDSQLEGFNQRLRDGVERCASDYGRLTDALNLWTKTIQAPAFEEADQAYDWQRLVDQLWDSVSFLLSPTDRDGLNLSGLVETLPLRQLYTRIQKELADVTAAASSERKLRELQNMAESILGADRKRAELDTRLRNDQAKVKKSRKLLKRNQGSILLAEADLDDDEKREDARDQLAKLQREVKQLKQDANTSLKAADTTQQELFCLLLDYYPEQLSHHITGIQQASSLPGLTSWTKLIAIASLRKFADYEVMDSLAGNHIVYMVKSGDDRSVLKRYPLTRDKTEIDAFLQEVQLLKRFKHPNIAKINSAFLDTKEGAAFVELAHYSQGNLEQWLGKKHDKANNTFKSQLVFQLPQIVQGLTQALFYLEREGIVHSDVKPENVFMTGTDQPMLGDFDASQNSATRTVRLTRARCNTVLVQHATPGYAANEVMFGTPDAPFRASSKQDVFSLGCVIYHMHMYPRSLREPQRRDDDVTDQGSVLEQDGEEASPAVAGALSRELVRSMVGPEPSSRPTFASLLEDPYLLQLGAASVQAYSEMAKVPVSWLHGHGDEQGCWGVQMDPAQCQEVRKT